MKGPSFVSTSADELATVIDGSYFAGRKADFNLAFGQAKYIGALWMAYRPANTPPSLHLREARQHHRHPRPQRPSPTDAVAAKYVMPALGLAHKLDVGAKRLVDGVTDRTCPARVLRQRGQQVKGPLVNQADILPDLGELIVQEERQPGHPPLHRRKNSGVAPHRLVPETPMKLLIAELTTPPRRVARTALND